MGLVNTNPFRAQGHDDYLVDLQFDTNGTSSPDGVAPNYADLVVARTGVGTFTLTFSGTAKPMRARVLAQVLGDEPTLKAVPVDYNPDTGVVTVKVYALASGAYSASDTTDKRVQVVMFCSKSRGSL